MVVVVVVVATTRVNEGKQRDSVAHRMLSYDEHMRLMC